MTEVTKDMISRLRSKTGAGIMDCKTALQKSGGNLEEALTVLRKQGIAIANKKASRATSEGCIFSYIHPGGKIGVLLELNCETDFVSRTDDFSSLAKELAMQVAAMNPKWVKSSDVPDEVIEKEKEILKTQALKEGKPEKVIDKILQGRLEKFYQQNCLMDQIYIRDTQGKQSISVLMQGVIGKLGENMNVRRFVRFQLGGE
ncbi:MAG: translation elongation factor Ts [bacterium]